MTRLLACACALLSAAALDTVLAQPREDVVSAIGLARIAEERGAVALRAHLTGKAAVADALVAIRASAHVDAPESLLAPLAELACGRHPLLAPEAAYAIFRIAELLRPSELDAREALLADLRSARAALACPGAVRPGADIALLLERGGALLDALAR